VLRTVTFSRVSARHRLAVWVRFLALTAAHAERPFSAATVGRARTGAHQDATVTVARLAPLAEDPETRRALALAHLETLVDLDDRGMREPLPIACLTSAAYARAAADGRDAAAAARREWESKWNSPKEDAELEHELAFGGVLSLDDLLVEAPCEGEEGEGWEPGERSRFGRLARRLWAGPLAREVIDDR
jgi:exodeoxyribonuclease V gamma subunit